MSASQEIVFFVNGEKVADPNVDPEWTLLYYLRKKLYLSGTKLGCAEGGCGACTVMISRYDHEAQKVVHLSANACLTPVCAVHGQAVTTVEGIGSTQRGLHAVQQRIAAAHGSQCGFCTPGIVMSMYALLRACSADGKTRKPSIKDLEVAFQGNLCRCTGYRPIIEGFRTLTEEWERCDSRLLATNGASIVNGCVGGLTNGCCKTNGKVNGNGCCQANGEVNGSCDEDERAPGDMEILFDTSKFKPYDSSQEPIFPPELQLSQGLDQQYLMIKGPRVTWYRPTTLEQLLLLKHIHPQARIVVGNTEIGVEVKFKNLLYPVLMHPTKVKELVAIHQSSSGIKFGSSVTLNDIDSTLKTAIDRLPEPKTRVFKAIVDMLHWFAGKQIRNVAAVGGNIMTGSPISDLNPIFIAANCEIELASKDGGRRTVTMDGSFFTGYRKNIVKPNEVMLSITVPYSHEGMFFKAYKQARRREDDISIVNAAFQVEFDGSRPPVVKKANLVFGGMAPTVVEAKKAAKILVGRKIDAQLMEDVCNVLSDELPLSPDAPGGMIAYRRSLTLGFFYKFFVDLHENICRDDPSMECLPERLLSASQGLSAATPQSSQYFQVVPPDQPKIDPIGRPIPHSSAFKQATGEAVYCDDLPRFENELYLSLVLSTRAHAKVVSIDADPALAIEGVRAFFCASDLDPMRNKLGVMVKDEEIFASSIVESIGQVIGAVVAIDQATAQRASKLVKVVYEDLHPLILTIEEAIAHKSFHEGTNRMLTKGDVDAGMKMSTHVLEGEVHLGGQEHFYLETNCAIAIPREDGNELEVICSTQHPDELQRLISEAVGMKANHIVCRVKRLGGAFGGKETQSPIIAVPVAIAALKLKRAVRCMLDRDEDMVATGGRNPFHGKYKMGFTSDGKILSYEVDLYNNAGRSLDLSSLVIEQALMLGQNGYNIPNVRSKGVCCKTNLQSNTAFRGFGAPQGMLITENAITDVAAILGVDPAKIREKNMVKNGDTMIYDHTLQNCTLQKCWEECLKKSAYNQKRRESEAFNKKNRWRKRGVCILPTMFGISLVFPINQAGALVLVYTDGSVLITHGGTEMGQGLHTKMIQVASRVLEIPEDIIYISETSTDKIPNAPPTAASSSSDLNGMAVLNACRKIKQRLKPYVAADPKGSWNDWVNAAYLDSVNLSASGFYRSPNPGYDWETHTGNPHHYYTYGAACSEVEIDCLTGDHQVLSTDIVMDLGESLNPAIDIGQVEGAFMQGYGLYTLEELTYSPTGMLYSRGPGTYKIPGFSNIPTKFNVSLLRGAPNPRAVYSSKAVGEPPLALAMSVFFAIKDAITSARSESGLSGPFRLDSPATSARIRMACEDHITKKVSVEEGGPSWNIIP
ncbi:xanthine dehydrogenase-like [Ischnura elegans]|uniref:xanthine dehydrogenase-like n=1 Tax=Ischnura elegans TaxID=197161 RepID=UPI001ED8BD5D|nr:xanthine dehydrogenase-like [Ischnura elegans]